MRFKLLLCFSLLIPISTQTGPDLILSDNWAIEREIQWMKWKLNWIDGEIKYYESKRAIQLAKMEIRRNGLYTLLASR